MKYIKIIFALILAAACTFSSVACKTECNHDRATATGYYKEVGGKVFNAAKCNTCGKSVTIGEEIFVHTVADDANDVVIAQGKTDFYLSL